ncbi:MAG TPA: hypothetical protein VH257_04875, partial [Chloroflexota bacterium]|nr:hypothetical protein [Chloroflexota bacterium]
MTAEHVALVAPSPLGAPAELALARLSAALQQRGWTCRRERDIPAAGDAALVIVAAIASADLGRLTHDLGLSPSVVDPGTSDFGLPEALAIRPLPPQGGRPATVLLLGGDNRGLSYALLESARRVELEGPVPGAGPAALLDCFPPTTESPQRPLRSLCVFPHNAVLEQEWYGSLDFWRWYFDLLALHRFNRFTLTFGHQTAYLAPPYPFFVPVPEHPEVRPTGFDARAREEHLALLQGIAGLAVERGLDFCLGIWSQHAHSYGPSTVSGLDQDNLASYCAAGLRRLLEACPQVSAVQLRLNAESGVHLDEGARFWRALFDGVAACGRRVTLDLRAKAIADDTIAAALATGLPVLVNTKFWTEHQGLPYHATLLQEGDRYVRRHSYADQLRYGDSPGISAGGAAGGPAGGPAGGAPGGRPRPYDFLFQLWNLGTNRLLLWADPQWVRRFAASSTLAGATGFEVCAPLSHKGFGNRGGAWSIFADPSLRPSRWEQERYWPWYLLFGRLGYHGDASPDVWRREWAARFGREAAPHLERALQAASGVLPLLTARHSPSASVFGYWPEKDMGGLLDLYLQVPASDVAMFASAQEAAAARLGGTPDARQTPLESGAAFSRFASEAEAALERALATATPTTESAARELRGVALDVRVQATLARYHAAKLSAATHLAAFYAAGDLDSLLAARPPAAEALAAWEQLVRLTDGVYQDDLIFGR